MYHFRLAILTIVVVVTSCSTMPNRADPGYTLDEGLVYSRGDGWELAMDIAVPEIGREPFPVVLYFYGNSWKWGDRGDYHRVVIPDMISHGYAVALVDCRGVPQFRYPSQSHDAKEAVRWLRAHATEYGIDPRTYRCPRAIFRGLPGANAGPHRTGRRPGGRHSIPGCIKRSPVCRQSRRAGTFRFRWNLSVSVQVPRRTSGGHP